MTTLRVDPVAKAFLESDARVVGANAGIERAILICLMVLLYMAYGALGRDVFFNRLMYGYKATVYDPIGAVLPYVQVLLCCITIMMVVAGTNINWAVSKIPWMLAPFCLWAIASCFWGEDPKNSFRNAVTTTMMWMALSMLIHRLGLATSTRVTLHVIAMVAISSFFIALIFPSIGRHSGLEAVQQSHIGEWRGIFAHKNALGPWAAWGSIFLFTHSSTSRAPAWYWWLARIAAVTCLIFCHSATSIVVCGIMWVMWMCMMLLRRLSLGSFLALVILPLALVLLAAFVFKTEILELLGRDETFTGRTIIWDLDAQFFWQRPFLGHGFQTMGGPAFNERLVAIFGQPLSPESAYWAMLLDVGLIGFLLFMIPYLLAIRNGFEWMKHVVLVDRACLEMLIILLASVLIIGITEAQVLLSTGFDGVVTFTGLFALLTTPKSPQGVLRGEFRLAKHRIASPRRGH